MGDAAKGGGIVRVIFGHLWNTLPRRRPNGGISPSSWFILSACCYFSF
jgi:fucose 4-O-acetylase-like acetyltransferase